MKIDDVQRDAAREGIARWGITGWGTPAAWSTLAAAHQYEIAFDHLNQALGTATPKQVLDWGCGIGIMSYALLRDGHEVWATDLVVPPMGDFLDETAPGRFHYEHLTEPTRLPYPDQSMDVVLSMGTLEHVGESGGSDRASLAEIHRVLRPGGRFVCCHLPKQGSYIEAGARAIKKPAKRILNRFVYAHPILYDEATVHSLAAEAGFSVDRFDTYGVLPRNPLSGLPFRLGDRPWVVRAVDGLDHRLNRVLANHSQNIAWTGTRLS